MQNEYTDSLIKKIGEECTACGNPIEEYDSPENLELSIGCIWMVGFGFYCLSFIVLMISGK